MEKTHQLMLGDGIRKVRCGRINLTHFDKYFKPIYSLKFTVSDLDKVNCFECLESKKMAKEKYEKWVRKIMEK